MDRKARALALIAPAILVSAILVLRLAAAEAQPAPAAPPAWPLLTVTPPDLEARDPELAGLRDRLLAAIAARDLAAVKALMAPTLRDQDTEVPVDEVLAAMGPIPHDPGVQGTPGSSASEWRAFEQALRLGGVRVGSRYVVPFFAPAARSRPSAGTEVFVAGRDVAVRDAASGAAPILARVSNAVLRAAVVSDVATPGDASGCTSWTAVVTVAVRAGWVCAADTRPMTGIYYDFERIDGAWRLTALWSVP